MHRLDTISINDSVNDSLDGFSNGEVQTNNEHHQWTANIQRNLQSTANEELAHHASNKKSPKQQ